MSLVIASIGPDGARVSVDRRVFRYGAPWHDAEHKLAAFRLSRDVAGIIGHTGLTRLGGFYWKAWVAAVLDTYAGVQWEPFLAHLRACAQADLAPELEGHTESGFQLWMAAVVHGEPLVAQLYEVRLGTSPRFHVGTRFRGRGLDAAGWGAKAIEDRDRLQELAALPIAEAVPAFAAVHAAAARHPVHGHRVSVACNVAHLPLEPDAAVTTWAVEVDGTATEGTLPVYPALGVAA